jgi:hypothetical protein
MTTAVRRSVLLCVIALLAAACGLQKTPHAAGTHSHHRPAKVTPPASSTPRTSRSPHAVVTSCTMAQIQVRLDTRSAGVAAGSSFIPLDFTNIGPASCTLGGFPQVSVAAGSTGKLLGAAATLDRSAAARPMVLSSGQSAHIWLRLVDVANIPATRCDPVAAAGLRVSLPGQQPGTYVAHSMTTCAKPVTGTDVLTVEPFRPGAARPGTAQ